MSLLNMDGEEFMYQITSTTVMHRDDLSLYDTEDSTITLVACVPRLIYDHRIVVSRQAGWYQRARLVIQHLWIDGLFTLTLALSQRERG